VNKVPEPPAPEDSLDDAPEAESQTEERGGELGLIFHAVAAMLVLAVVVFFAARWFREPLQRYGTLFVERFGPGGMLLGTIVADGLHCPIPPQAYMLAAIAAGYSPWRTLAFICVGSVLGAGISIAVGRWAARAAMVRRFLQKSQGRVDQLFCNHGHWAVLIGSVTPTPFSLLCNLAGLYRLPLRMLALLVLLRIPRLCLYYALIYFGWS